MINGRIVCSFAPTENVRTGYPEKYPFIILFAGPSRQAETKEKVKSGSTILKTFEENDLRRFTREGLSSSCSSRTALSGR